MKYKIAWLMIVAFLPLLAGAQMDGLLKKVKTKVNQWGYNKVHKPLHKVEGKKETITKDSVSQATGLSLQKMRFTPVIIYSKYDFIPGEHILIRLRC